MRVHFEVMCKTLPEKKPECVLRIHRTNQIIVLKKPPVLVGNILKYYLVIMETNKTNIRVRCTHYLVSMIVSCVSETRHHASYA